MSPSRRKKIMKKVLITGMTASHCSRDANNRSLGFSGVMNLALSSVSGVDVVWGQPSVNMTRDFLEQFDAVLVGVSPLTSLSSNYTYGSLSIISEMRDSDKLFLFVDTSSPRQIGLSINNLVSNPEKLTKPLFSTRKDAKSVFEDKKVFEKIANSVEFLHSSIWPTTIYASLPWKSGDRANLPSNAKSNIASFNFDSYLIDQVEYSLDRVDKWVVDNYRPKWTQKAVGSLSLPDAPMKWSRKVADTQVLEQICRSIGAIISPDERDGTYWNYRYVQAIATGTPVATYWPESCVLGEPWSVLSSRIDSMSHSERDSLAKEQKKLYVSNIPTKKEAVKSFTNLLGVSKEK